MQNGIHTLEDLFAVNAFRIPQYQRAYSWEEEQLRAFLEDLRQQASTQARNPNKQYFLGTFLLHEQDVGDGERILNVVDGQQRMTTAVVFVATAVARAAEGRVQFTTEKPALLKRNFVVDDIADRQKFHTIAEDEPYFRTAILRTSSARAQAQESPSAKRLEAAARYFAENVTDAEWEPLLRALRTARVMVYAVDTAEAATQIFELQNDRGKALTNLEALKSFLMHCIYLHSPKSADDRLAVLQTQFATIFRDIDALADVRRAPDEDQILGHHCAAFLRWRDREDYSNPKALVKELVKDAPSAEVVPWIEAFVGDLQQSYRGVREMFDRRDELVEFTDLFLLGRMAPFWPLVVKTWNHDETPDKANFRKTCRLLEVFAFRGYAVANLRSDTALSWLHITARDFDGTFDTLFERLCDLSSGYHLADKFTTGLDNPSFYESEGGDALYLLWRYENHLRNLPGKKQPRLSWRDFVEPNSYAAKFSVEHVAAQSNAIATTLVRWGDGEPKLFADVALHRLGNLVIDSVSSNASKGKKDFCDKLKSLSEDSVYLSQGELVRFTPDRMQPEWGVEAVRARHQVLVDFCMRTWDPRTWHPARV